jgi:hypothetical protein
MAPSLTDLHVTATTRILLKPLLPSLGPPGFGMACGLCPHRPRFCGSSSVCCSCQRNGTAARLRQQFNFITHPPAQRLHAPGVQPGYHVPACLHDASSCDDACGQFRHRHMAPRVHSSIERSTVPIEVCQPGPCLTNSCVNRNHLLDARCNWCMACSACVFWTPHCPAK